MEHLGQLKSVHDQFLNRGRVFVRGRVRIRIVGTAACCMGIPDVDVINVIVVYVIVGVIIGVIIVVICVDVR